jgi:hypothetical protein
LVLEIYGIDTEKDYTVEFIDAEGNSSTRTMPGQELGDSLELKIDKPGGSLLVRYTGRAL